MKKLSVLQLLCAITFQQVQAEETKSYEDLLREEANVRIEEMWNYCKPRADKGDMEAQRMMGHMYLNGVGVKENIHKAKEWFLKAANQGDEESRRYFLGICELEKLALTKEFPPIDAH